MQKLEGEGTSVAGNKVSDGNLYLLFTVGVPGLGKSFLVSKMVEFLEKLPDHIVKVCISDEVRSKVLADYYEAQKIDLTKLSQEEIYKIENDNAPEVRARLFDSVSEQIGKLLASGKRNCFFIMDKNYCSNQLIQYTEEQAKQNFPGWNIHHGVLVPESFEEGDSRKFYPFKVSTLLVGLERSVTRKVHLTMKYGSIHSLLSFISCLQSQLKDPFDEKFPPAVYKRIRIHYYDEGVMEKGSLDPQFQPLLKKVEEIVSDLVSKKKPIPEACPELVDVIKQLEPLNVFANLGEEEFAALLDRIKKTT
jgi:hypothetical protein